MGDEKCNSLMIPLKKVGIKSNIKIKRGNP
jgi:hypothetical protein